MIIKDSIIKKLLVVIVFILSTIFILASFGCGESKDAVVRIKEKGELLVYTNAEFPPYEFMKGEEIIGVDIKIAEAIAEKLGVKLVMKSLPYDGLLASISSGKSDFGIAAFTVTDERKEKVDFSLVYDKGVQYLLLPKDSKVKTIEELNNTKLGCQAGTTGQFLIEDDIFMRKILSGKKTECKTYASPAIALEDVKKGILSAVVVDKAVAQNLVKQNKDYKAVPYLYKNGKVASEEYAIAFKKDSSNFSLIELSNEVIKDLLKADKIKEWLVQYALS